MAKMRETARNEGRRFQAVLEDAMWVYIDGRERPNVRLEVMAYFRASADAEESHGALGQLVIGKRRPTEYR